MVAPRGIVAAAVASLFATKMHEGGIEGGGDLRALVFLVIASTVFTSILEDSGDLFVVEDDTSNQAVRLYSHGIATIALCEAYNLTGDKALRAPAQAAINFIVHAQDPVGGGWRYQPRQSGDLSVTGWQALALQAVYNRPLIKWRTKSFQK